MRRGVLIAIIFAGTLAGDASAFTAKECVSIMGESGDPRGGTVFGVVNQVTPFCEESKSEAEEESKEASEAATENATVVAVALSQVRPEPSAVPSPEEPSPEPSPEALPTGDEMAPEIVPPVSPILDATPFHEPNDTAPDDSLPAPMQPDDERPRPAPEPISTLSAERIAAPKTMGPATVVATLAGAAALSGLLLGPAAFYNRMTKERVDENALRKGLLDLIRKSPGTNSSRLAAALGVHHSTVRHHLDMLVQFGHVVPYQEGRRGRYFENHGRIPLADRQGLACLQRGGNRAFLISVLDRPGGKLVDLAAASGTSIALASYRARRLVEAGLLDRRARAWSVSERGRRLLQLIHADDLQEPGRASTASAGRDAHANLSVSPA